MIKQEKEMINGRVLIHTYSDAKKKINDGNGVLYDDAYDVRKYAYTETDTPINEVRKDDTQRDYASTKSDIILMKADLSNMQQAIEANAAGIDGIINSIMEGSE